MSSKSSVGGHDSNLLDFVLFNEEVWSGCFAQSSSQAQNTSRVVLLCCLTAGMRLIVLNKDKKR
jgi:hypothetical protein